MLRFYFSGSLIFKHAMAARFTELLEDELPCLPEEKNAETYRRSIIYNFVQPRPIIDNYC